ncbi:transmembrane protein 40 isoform X3 [Gopherus flavomarginatus]|uniref:transmembrane protein 40 isoform X3 n=1 Tax=Gopherus flavomarginatus TaxID=286002 RepID=UPI0021CBFD65|nr:transmembrane protein 40 isoform X3 [Gopherus flavomarginatus]
MDNFNFSLPVLTRKQQDIFQKAFAADADYLETSEKMNQSFWELLIKCLATVNPASLTTEEMQNLLNRGINSSDERAASLKTIGKKGVNAMVVLYLLLKVKDLSAYRELPSSKKNDEKLKLLQELEISFTFSQDSEVERSSREPAETQPRATSAGKKKVSVATVKPISHNQSQEDQDHENQDGSEIARRENATAAAGEKVTYLQRCQRQWIRIRKNDVFFHFIILCFGIGAALISYYQYKDWTISLGFGLITFASLETTGIYFGLVHRIHSVLEGFIPLIQRFKIPECVLFWKAVTQLG